MKSVGRSIYAANLLRIASSLADEAPLMSYELSSSTRRIVGDDVRVSVVNPGMKTFEEYVGQMVVVLKSLSQELEKSLQDLDTAKEFAKFFTGQLVEEEELQELLNKAQKLGKVASRYKIAGFKDWFKDVTKFFRQENDEAEKAGMQPTYQLDDSTMDDFVEGSVEWTDASYYIEQEFKENREFFDGANQVLKDMEALRKAPTAEAVESILERVKRYIRTGENILRGFRKHLLEPSSKVDLGDDSEKEKSISKPSSDPLWNLESTVEHYVDVLRDNLGDEKKTLSLLKELFGKVKPALSDGGRGELGLAARTAAQRRILPVLIRLAHSRPQSRPVLMPIIRQATGR